VAEVCVLLDPAAAAYRQPSYFIVLLRYMYSCRQPLYCIRIAVRMFLSSASRHCMCRLCTVMQGVNPNPCAASRCMYSGAFVAAHFRMAAAVFCRAVVFLVV
jgi:hypothetical protein